MTTSVFRSQPDCIERNDVTVLQQTTLDDLPHIEALWPSFEQLVGLKGRKMYARADLGLGTYTVCTPLREGDHPEQLGVEVGTLAGGSYLRGRIVGEAPESYGRIADGMKELRSLGPTDEDRPLVEFYRRHDEIELWVPIRPATRS